MLDATRDVLDLVESGEERQVAFGAQLVVQAGGFSQDADVAPDLLIFLADGMSDHAGCT